MISITKPIQNPGCKSLLEDESVIFSQIITVSKSLIVSVVIEYKCCCQYSKDIAADSCDYTIYYSHTTNELRNHTISFRLNCQQLCQ
jgi:hypothetical protein